MLSMLQTAGGGVPASGATAGCELASDSWRGHDSSATNSRLDTLLVPLIPLPPDGTTLEGTQCFFRMAPLPEALSTHV